MIGTYSGMEWLEAFNQADDYGFDEIDSREHAGELAGVMAELRNSVEAGCDEGLLFAAITVAGDLAETFDREFLTRVLNSYDEDGANRLAARAEGYVLARWPDFPIGEIGDLHRFGAKYALREQERVADDGVTGFQFLFNVAGLITLD